MDTANCPPADAPNRPAEEAASVQDYAGFWRRAAAAVVDAVIVAVPLAVGIYFLFPAQIMTDTTQPPSPGASYLVFLVVYVLAVIAYMAGLESSARQATLGKQLLGIRVTDMERRRISFFRAVKRGWFYWLPTALVLLDNAGQFMVFSPIATIVAAVSCFAVAFTERNQALHDIAAGCLLLHRNAEAA